MESALLGMISLGGLYAISNQENRVKKKENFQNKNQRKLAETNYPINENSNNLANDINKYPNSNAATDKYFEQKSFENKYSKTNVVKSLNGNNVNLNDFKHNNMVPFFGGKIRGRGADLDQAESILDNMAGLGTQNIKKVEQAPLFTPEDNMQWSHGQPNQSDFYQSRQVPSLTMNNVKPWTSQNVGPGLNNGFSNEGSNGFNSGLMSRDKYLPKTVNELRVNNNPKITFDLENHEGPAISHIKESGKLILN